MTAQAHEPPLVDLLYRTRASVAVSSNVLNVHDYPEHLIDRRPETAWNGKTGDLTAHIELRVPATARVRRVLITPGYDKVGKDGDLFAMNHRLKRVAIDREGARIAEVTLDPESRAAQPIELDVPGGTFVITPLETVPGSNPKWREIVVSELVVLGTAPDDELLPPAMPPVSIGALDARVVPRGPLAALRAAAPYPTIEAYCARVFAQLAREREARKQSGREDTFLDELEPVCEAAKIDLSKPSFAAPFVDAKLLTALEGLDLVTRLAVRTTAGWFPTDVALRTIPRGPGCGQWYTFAITSLRAEASKELLVAIDKHTAYCSPGIAAEEAAGSFVVACRVGADDKLDCKQHLVASFEGDCSFMTRGEGPRFAAKPPAWDWTRAVVADERGGVRLLPCVDGKGVEVACDLRNAALLGR